MNEIKEIDINKYLIFKWDDIRELPLDTQGKIAFIQGYIETFRHGKGKKDNKYLVLNLDDRFSIHYLFQKLVLINEKTRFNQKWKELKIKDIAVDLVNAILKAKELK